MERSRLDKWRLSFLGSVAPLPHLPEGTCSGALPLECATAAKRICHMVVVARRLESVRWQFTETRLKDVLLGPAQL
jgi:hypothetical protein